MDRASDPPRARPRFWAVAAAIAAVVLAVVYSSAWWRAPPPSVAGTGEAGADGPGLWAFSLLFVAMSLMVAVLAGLLGGAIARSRLSPSLRQARAERQALASLLDVWQWQTDVDHHLVRLLPPHGAPATSWSNTATSNQTLWERYTVTGDAEALAGRMRAHAALGDFEAEHREPTGPATQWLLRGAPLFDADAQFIGYIGTARALPEVPNAPFVAAPETREAPAVRQAVNAAPAPDNVDLGASSSAAGQFSDQEAFSYTVSHDLRAPIRVVEGFARIVKEDYGRVLDRIGIDHLDRVLGAAARMNNMIDALLNLSQLSSQPLSRQPVNLSQLAHYVVDDLRRDWPERDVDVHIDADLMAHGDPTLLRVALENLLGNAWKYTARTPHAKIRFENSPSGVAPCFTLRDNGAGFDMRFADRLFGVFQRLHSASDFQGTGVGLASVRRIVRRHGGEIWAESEIGRGAAFHFTLRD